MPEIYGCQEVRSLSENKSPVHTTEQSVEISVIMPVLNEEKILEATWLRVSKVLADLAVQYEIIFVDDGSTDGSGAILNTICKSDPSVKIITLSRNFGQQAAFTAGLDYCRGRAVVLLDSDLQDPPELIHKMYAEWKKGFQVVYSCRSERRGESIFKRATAAVFYRLWKLAAGGNIQLDAGDFKLLDRKVVEAIKQCPERSRFFRGLVSWAGFRSVAVEYVRDPRTAGETKYSIWKMIRLSVDAFLSSSRAPLRIGTWLGTIITILAMIIKSREVSGKRESQPLKASTMLILHGLTMFCHGVIGEYMARIHIETQGRPNYIVDSVISGKERE